MVLQRGQVSLAPNQFSTTTNLTKSVNKSINQLTFLFLFVGVSSPCPKTTGTGSSSVGSVQ